MIIDFNDNWIFYKEGLEESKVCVTTPHDAMIHEERTKDAQGGSASGFYPGGVYYYEKEYMVPETELDKKHILEFEGIYKNAEIYVNGKLVGKGAYGYSPIYVSIDDYIVSGANHITVKADNSNQPDSRWYSGAGIIRPVSMHILPKQHILIDGVRIKTESIEKDCAKLGISVRHTGGIKKITIEIYDKDKRNVVSNELSKKTISEENVCEVYETYDEILVNDTKPWTDQDPYLYHLIVKGFAEDNTSPMHVVESDFGIRKLEWSSNGFFVNGRETKLRGGCVHHDNGILGACSDKYAEERRVRLLKEAGYNAIRSSHNPCSKAMLEACDRYGMYMIDELWDTWYKHKCRYDYAAEFMNNYEEDIKLMVRRDYNHPCVIMYSIGNEVSEPASSKGIELSTNMKNMIHSLDDTRPVTAGYNLMIISRSSGGKDMYDEEKGGLGDSNSKKTQGMNSTLFNMMAMMVGSGMNKAANGKKADKVTSPAIDVLDIAGYNYASGRYPLEGRLHPDRIIYGSETFPQDIARNWEMVLKYPYIIGDFMWTSWDYLGEAGLGAWSYSDDAKSFEKPYPWLISGAGAFDILGNPNGALFLAQQVWGTCQKPIIGVQPCNHPGQKLIKSVWRGTNAVHSWAFKGCDGNKVTIEVFSNSAQVELILNGNSLGKKKVKDYVATYKTKYEPGELCAVAYDLNGNETGRDILRYKPSESKIRVKPEKEKVEKGETVFIHIDVVNSDGIIEFNEDRKIKVSVENGELLGFGSASPRCEGSFVSGEYDTYNGSSLAAVRGLEAGKAIVVKAMKEDGTESIVSIEIKTEKAGCIASNMKA